MYWYNTSESYNLLNQLKIVEKTVLAQTKDKYCYATVYDQGCALYGLNQHKFLNEQYNNKFITKVDIEEAIFITRHRHVFIEDTAQETLKMFDDLSLDKKKEVRKDTKERYLVYIFF